MISESEIDLCLRLTIGLSLEVTAVRRLEVISGTGRRRQFTSDFKARIVEETLVAGAVVSDVARQHGLTPQQVFTWRRQARQPLADIESKAPQFVPAVVETAVAFTGAARTAAQADWPGQRKLRKHRG